MKEKSILVDVSHLSSQSRMDAALWCFDRFDPIDVDFWGLAGSSSEFAFKKEKDAMAFLLAWS